jgi:hypothetical protein
MIARIFMDGTEEFEESRVYVMIEETFRGLSGMNRYMRAGEEGYIQGNTRTASTLRLFSRCNIRTSL